MQKTGLKEGTCSGVEDTVLAQETVLGDVNGENKNKIEDLEKELISVQEKLRNMGEVRRDAVSTMSSEEPRAEDPCFIKIEKVDAKEMVNKWVPPPEGYLKLNVEALNYSVAGDLMSESDRTGVGAVIRDHKGQIYRYMYCRISSNVEDFMLKVIAMREGLRWVQTLRLPVQGLIVETDCLVLAEQLGSSREEWFEYGLAVMECRVLLRSFDIDIVVKRVKREANRLARELAYRGRSSSYKPHTLHYHYPLYTKDSIIEAIVDSECPTEFKKKC